MNMPGVGSVISNRLDEILFESRTPAYAILDGALIDGLSNKLDVEAAHYVCLYRGNIEPWLERVAPYLVRIERGSKLFEWISTNGWGNHWGIFLTSEAPMRELRKHFRQFLLVAIPDQDAPVYFRYYDPRVLSNFLPTCTPGELDQVFGPVKDFYCEAGSANSEKIEVHSIVDGKLSTRKHSAR